MNENHMSNTKRIPIAEHAQWASDQNPSIISCLQRKRQFMIMSVLLEVALVAVTYELIWLSQNKQNSYSQS